MTYGVGRRNRSRGLGWRTHSKEFQIGNFAYTPGSLHKEWQIKEISQGNVPDWRYDQRGQSPSPERVKMTAWRGRRVRRAQRKIRSPCKKALSWLVRESGSDTC